MMEPETLEARLRNLIMPVYQLTALLETETIDSEQKMQLMKNTNLLEDVKTACSRIIQLGKEHS